MITYFCIVFVHIITTHLWPCLYTKTTLNEVEVDSEVAALGALLSFTYVAVSLIHFASQ